MGKDYYVYYKVRTEHGAQLQERVARLQRRLHEQLGIACSLKRRPHGKDGETACLVEIKIAEAGNTAIHLGAADGPVVRFQPLPYALPDEMQ